jgi:hypothetical protein
MSSVLAVLALIVLVGLGVLSLIRQREKAALLKQSASDRSHVGDAQHDRSMSRREAVRSAPEETMAPDGEPPGAGSPTVE